MDCRDRILSNGYRDVIVDAPIQLSPEEGTDYCSIDLDQMFYLLYINRLGLPPVMDTSWEYQSTPKLYGLAPLSGGTVPGRGAFSPLSLAASGISQVQGKPLALMGQGVVICVIGTGIDYTLNVFRDEMGESRILAIWDQTVQEGTPPEGFGYGTEYTREAINEALRAANPWEVVPGRDEIGQGTAMASVAAGSRLGEGNTFCGAAPEADIVVVKLKECKPYLREYYLVPGGVPAYEEQDIMLAVKYADSFAVPFTKPVVICLGVGTNMGDHDGNSALSRYLNQVAVRPGRTVVVDGGSEGSAGHHFQGKLNTATENSASQTFVSSRSFQDVEVRVSEGCRGFMMEFWGSVPDIFRLAVRTPGGESVSDISLGPEQSVPYSFIFERSKLYVSSILVEPMSGKELMVLRVEEPTAGIWTFRVSVSGEIHNGNYHMWLPLASFLSAEVTFLQPDPYVTLTEPSMAENVICASSYDDSNGSFYAASGRGYSEAGRIRPDFAAPCVEVSTVFGQQTGSALGAALAAGGVAQFLEWAVVRGNGRVAESRQIKNYFARGALRMPDLSYPNREWGYGRLNVRNVFEILAGV